MSKSLRLLSAVDHKVAGTYFTPDARPLVVMLLWMNAKKEKADKYCDIYLSRGYDVLTVTIYGWQFLFPTRGSQVVAQDLLDYLQRFISTGEQPLLLHGFSVGAYFWGEVLHKMKSDLSKYSEIIGRVKGIIWDSTPDFSDTIQGLPNAIAPRNIMLRIAVRTYVILHLLLFYPLATKHHLKSSRTLHSTPCLAPVLILMCRNDPIASVDSILNVKKSWESLGIDTSLKIWDESKHVSHYFIYPEEYLTEIGRFLEKINFPMRSNDTSRIQAKL